MRKNLKVNTESLTGAKNVYGRTWKDLKNELAIATGYEEKKKSKQILSR